MLFFSIQLIKWILLPWKIVICWTKYIREIKRKSYVLLPFKRIHYRFRRNSADAVFGLRIVFLRWDFNDTKQFLHFALNHLVVVFSCAFKTQTPNFVSANFEWHFVDIKYRFSKVTVKVEKKSAHTFVYLRPKDCVMRLFWPGASIAHMFRVNWTMIDFATNSSRSILFFFFRAVEILKYVFAVRNK